MRIGIVGAGIGGLCAAIGLQRAGAEVVVYESADQVRAGGSGLSIFGNGVRALDALGIGEQFRVVTARAENVRGGQRRPSGSWLSTFPADAVGELRIVDRAVFHQLLTASLSHDTIRTGMPVTQVFRDGTVETRCEEDSRTSRQRFDLVVAADGLRSTVRAQWAGDPGIAYAGYATWRGITAAPFDLRGEAGETWGNGRRFGVAPLADGRVYWFAVRTARIDEPESARQLRGLFHDWHHPIPDVIAATPESVINYLPIEELAGKLPSFVDGRVALLGDAAHAMTPNLGQGGGMALEDAATLVALLGPIARMDTAQAPALSERLSAALQKYDELRRPRTQHITARSRAIGKLAHVNGSVASALRDLVIRATPQAALRSQLSGIQNWRPPS